MAERPASISKPSVDQAIIVLPTTSKEDIESGQANKSSSFADDCKQGFTNLHSYIFTITFSLTTAIVFAGSTVHYLKALNANPQRCIWILPKGISRASGLMLYLNMAFVLFAVCYNTTHLLRQKLLRHAFFSRCFSVGNHISLHRHLGWSMVFFAWIHAIAQWALLARLTISQSAGLGVFLKLNFATGKCLAGNLTLILLTLIGSTSIEKPRSGRGGMSRIVSTPHLPYVLFYLGWYVHENLFCLSGPSTLPWMALYPRRGGYLGVISIWGSAAWVLDINLREISKTWQSSITRLILHPSQIIELQIEKRNFRAKMGQSVMICFLEYSMRPAHFLTLTSAPQDDYLSVQLRPSDDATQSMYASIQYRLDKLFETVPYRAKDCLYESARSSALPQIVDILLPGVGIRGPYGSVTDNIHASDVAVLVGAGRGTDPFASILKSLCYYVSSPHSTSRLSKVYLFWICKDFTGFEWFKSLLLALEAQDVNGCIEIHTYLTTIEDQKLFDAGHTGLQQDVTAGRPLWPKIFASIQQLHPSAHIGVFDVGPRTLTNDLRANCKLFSKNGAEFIWYGNDF